MAIELQNFTPFANLRFSSLDAAGLEFGVFMTKVAFDLPASGDCPISTEQEPFVLTDDYTGALNTSSLRYPSDFVPFKPVTDLVLDATAYAPGGMAGDWQVAVSLADAAGEAVRAGLRITGPRQWQPDFAKEPAETAEGQAVARLLRGWRLTLPDPISDLDLRYEYAFGGPQTIRNADGDVTTDYDERNPLGIGRVPHVWEGRPHPVAAPQIEHVDRPITASDDAPDPAGFSPLPPAWLPRRTLGGTYDQDWQDTTWPGWARDYDFAYHNSAHPRLRADRLLQGALDVRLDNLHPERPVWTFRITMPNLRLLARLTDGKVTELALQTDTVFLDIGRQAVADPRAFVICRTPFDMALTEGLALIIADAAAAPGLRLHPGDVGCDPAVLDPRADDHEPEATEAIAQET